MDTNFFFAVFLAMIFIIIITSLDDAFSMLIVGLLVAIAGMNLTTIFTISSSYGSWIPILQGIYGFIAIGAFGGSAFATKSLFSEAK